MLDIRVGARVVTWQLGGGLAEYVTVPTAEVQSIPEGLSPSIAAAMLVDYQTARYSLVERGNLLERETVVVAGASGGVGSAAVQIAASLGARVIALVSDAARGGRAAELGAVAVLSPSDPQLRAELRRLAPGGIDVVVDPVGGDLTEKLFRSLAKHGRHLVVGFASGAIPSLPANLALLKSASLIGVDLRHFVSKMPDKAREACQNLFVQVLEQQLAPPSLVEFGFAQATDALAATSLRGRQGKPVVVLT
ncbi:zinc-binding dehydrogenase [Agrobacterium salinitolerans]